MYRLEGLAGLSVQDAELKLFAEKSAAGTPAGGAHESSLSPTWSNANGDAPRDTTAVARAVNDTGGKKKKKKRAKKQPAVTQRGPLLITHSGEMHSSCVISSLFRVGGMCARMPVPSCRLCHPGHPITIVCCRVVCVEVPKSRETVPECFLLVVCDIVAAILLFSRCCNSNGIPEGIERNS